MKPYVIFDEIIEWFRKSDEEMKAIPAMVCKQFNHIWNKKRDARGVPGGNWRCYRCGKRRRARRR